MWKLEIVVAAPKQCLQGEVVIRCIEETEGRVVFADSKPKVEAALALRRLVCLLKITLGVRRPPLLGW